MTTFTREDYQKAVRHLLPSGDWWEKQLANSESDVSLWCDAKAEELYRLHVRRADLLAEAYPKTTEELLIDWERIYNLSGVGLDDVTRRANLLSKRNKSLNIPMLQTTTENYGFRLNSVSFIGETFQLGTGKLNKRLWNMRVWNIIHLDVGIPASVDVAPYETAIKAVLLANQAPQFFYTEVVDL